MYTKIRLYYLKGIGKSFVLLDDVLELVSYPATLHVPDVGKSRSEKRFELYTEECRERFLHRPDSELQNQKFALGKKQRLHVPWLLSR
jgi:hypothetical protein